MCNEKVINDFLFCFIFSQILNRFLALNRNKIVIIHRNYIDHDDICRATYRCKFVFLTRTCSHDKISVTIEFYVFKCPIKPPSHKVNTNFDFLGKITSLLCTEVDRDLCLSGRCMNLKLVTHPCRRGYWFSIYRLRACNAPRPPLRKWLITK